MPYPIHRGRRLRGTRSLRELVRETRFSPAQLIYPLFVRDGEGLEQEIPSMPGQYQLSPDRILRRCREVLDLGLGGVILFGIPKNKDAHGREAREEGGIIQETVRAIKAELPELLVVTDLCLCEYTDHGHCGVLKGDDVDNDATLELLAETAVVQARAGADVIAPSDMMDGRVQAVRRALDENGFTATPIMSYAAKYASSFYGPFREAAESAPRRGDRRGYQMDPPNAVEALREVQMDIEEGADIVMVKPALPYLDIVAMVKSQVDVPVAAYNVSGEYAMVKAAARMGWLDDKAVMMEMLTSIFRAGADIVITYFAPDAARLLRSAGP